MSTEGSFLFQVLNWLKWKALNETLSSELRITAFQSLWQCSEKEAKAAATLITQRNSDSQGISVKIKLSKMDLLGFYCIDVDDVYSTLGSLIIHSIVINL